MNALTPREIVSELDCHIVGQESAKRSVAVAMRNRWRRRQLPEDMQRELIPKNMLIIGPTGCGKTEIARRLAKLADAPFLKVEATKYTEVGYVGRDVEQIIRDLVEISVQITRQRLREEIRTTAEAAAEVRVLEILIGSKPAPETLKQFQEKLREGLLDATEIEMELAVPSQPQSIELPGMPGGMQGVSFNLSDIFGKNTGQRVRRKMPVQEALRACIEEEADRLVDDDRVHREAIRSAEEDGIVFIDEIDKITAPEGRHGGDVSREGVQRDLLPLIEGTSVATKYGAVKSDYVLFIASGAFQLAKPSDLLPELQGRLPIRVTCEALSESDLRRILVEPTYNLIRQTEALMEAEGFKVSFSEEAISEIARLSHQINSTVENIGARRLHAVIERLVEDISFGAPDCAGQSLVIGPELVRERLSEAVSDLDLARSIL